MLRPIVLRNMFTVQVCSTWCIKFVGRQQNCGIAMLVHACIAFCSLYLAVLCRSPSCKALAAQFDASVLASNRPVQIFMHVNATMLVNCIEIFSAQPNFQYQVQTVGCTYACYLCHIQESLG